MALIQYVAKIAVDKDTGLPLPELRGQGGTIIARGNPSSTPTIYEDKDGSLAIPGSAITVNGNGFTSSFWVDDADLPISWWDGSIEVPLESVEGVAIRLDDLEVLFADTATQANAASQAALLIEGKADAALSLATPLDRVTALKGQSDPIIVGHRGGARVHPEHTLEGYRECFRSGFLPEVDIRQLSTGELVAVHDATTGRTMTGPSTAVNTMSKDEWKRRTVKSPWLGGAGAAPAMWEEVLDEFGGRTVIVAEIKDDAATADVIDSVARRGLHRSVILQSFTLATVQETAQAGIASMYLCGKTTAVTPQDLASDGIEFLGPGKGMASVDIATFQAGGIKVVPYTVGLPADWIDLQAKGVDGAFFDDPWGATGRYPRGTRDPFATAKPWPGWAFWDAAGSTPADQPINFLSSQGGLYMNGLYEGATTGSSTLRQGWAEPITIPSTSGGDLLWFRGTLMIDNGGGGTDGNLNRWLGVFIGNTLNGAAYNDHGDGAPDQGGYHFLFRRNGEMEVFKAVANASPTNILEVASSTPFAAADQARKTEVEIIIHGTQIRVRRLDTGETGAVTDTTYRTNLDLHLSMNGTNGQWRNLSYQKVPAATLGF